MEKNSWQMDLLESQFYMYIIYISVCDKYPHVTTNLRMERLSILEFDISVFIHEITKKATNPYSQNTPCINMNKHGR